MNAFSRREALALLLGSALAETACRRRRPPLFPGSLRGSGFSVGHRLRAERPIVATTPPKRVRIAIVGAGPSGLSAAWRLERSGEKGFVVFDLESQPGGTAAFGTDGVVAYPWGAHYVPMPAASNRTLSLLLSEASVLDRLSPTLFRPKETQRVREPAERVFYEGRWYQGLFPAPDAHARAELRRFESLVAKWVGFRDEQGRRAFTLPLRGCSRAAEAVALDRMSAARWLTRHGFSSPRFLWYVELACRDDYGASLEQTSAWALLFYFAARVSEPGRPSAPFLTWPEGNGRLVRHLTRLVGSRLKLGHLVTDVLPREHHVELSVLNVKDDRLEKYVADHAVLAVPRFVAARLVRRLRHQDTLPGGDFSYGAWWVANIHLSRRPQSEGFPFAWDNVLYDSPSVGYVVATHQTLRDHGPTIWTYYQPMLDSDPKLSRRKLQSLDHEHFCDALFSDLSRAHQGLADAIERIDVWRWGHAMVRPTPGLIWGEERRRAAARLGRVHFAHTDLSGVALLEEAVDHGVRAADEISLAMRGKIDAIPG